MFGIRTRYAGHGPEFTPGGPAGDGVLYAVLMESNALGLANLALS